MSVFDPDEFLQATIEGSNSTSRPPIPEHEAMGVIEKISIRTPNQSTILDVFWGVDSDEARNATGLDSPSVRQSIFLDIDGNGHLDMSEGMNVQLGRLRKAVGQNAEGPWSFNNLVGATARIAITQRPDQNDPQTIYNDVKSVTKAA